MAEKTATGIKVNSRIKTVDRGTITQEDHKYFSQIKIKPLEGNGYLISFITSSLEYYNRWIVRTSATYVDDVKESRRLDIESEIGDTRDRIADNFKLTAILLITVSEMYKVMSKTEKEKLSANTKACLDLLVDKRENGSIFQIETKQNVAEEFSKLIDRENEIADIFTKEVIGG